MTFVPDPILPGWTDIDATTTGRWGLTGDAGACDRLPTERVSLHVRLTCSPPSTTDGEPARHPHGVDQQGRVTPRFSGAVDKLVINTETFDFEPTGVITTTTP